MATSTFDKTIYIDNDAADKIIAILNKPAVPVIDTGDDLEKGLEALE